MPWFRKAKRPKPVRNEVAPSSVPHGLWVKCDGCREIIYSKELDRNQRICPKCGFHFRIDVDARVELLLDEPEPAELFAGLTSRDPLNFKDTKSYGDRLKQYESRLGKGDAMRVVVGHLDENPVVLGVMDYRFMGGSMGSAVGEKVARAAEAARDQKRSLILVSASGGARMQEGILSLMQMAKISVALAKLREAGLPYISILTDPTTGGVTASFAMQGDINIAEPGALIGFAGPRVIEQTIRESLPEGFQRSEFLLEHGFLDLVVARTDLKSTVARCLQHLRT